jgi:uncharacterized protein (TIGR01244 family)
MSCTHLLGPIVLILASAGLVTAQNDAPAVKSSELGQTRNVHVCGSLFLAGQPTQDDIELLKQKGIKRVITLREDGEIQWDEAAALKAAGVEFVPLPFRDPAALTDELFDRARQMLRESETTPTMLHCGSANRVGAVWLAHRVLDQGVPLERAIEEAKTVGLRAPALEQRAVDYIRRQATPQSVRPGINDGFLNADLDVQEWIGRFEVESREVYAARGQVVKASGAVAGSRVADIGAGTGLYTRLFSEVVGSNGWVFAVDISPRFVEHIARQARADRLTNVSSVLCPENSISLPPESIDIAFICDTYHHFEYPQATLASIHRSLRAGGTLVLIDFERIPGQSRPWIIDHVRAGKQEFRKEIEAAGFELVEEVPITGFQENYCLRFKRVGNP